MPNDEHFRIYIEALTELSDLDQKHRSALRSAVDASSAAERRAKERTADQQRMYDRAKRDAQEAEQALVAVKSSLNLAHSEAPTGAHGGSSVRALARIRAEISEVDRWARESKSTAESLIRTRERLSNAPEPAKPEQSSAPDIEPETVSRGRIPAWAAVAAIALLATIVLVVLLFAQ